MKTSVKVERAAARTRMSAEFGIPAETAQNLMNRFYRLCGAETRLLYLENDDRTVNLRWVQDLSQQRDKRREKLDKDFSKYGLALKYFGYLPQICEAGTTREAVPRYFY